MTRLVFTEQEPTVRVFPAQAGIERAIALRAFGGSPQAERSVERIPALTSSMAVMIPGVSQPEIQRQVRQQRADIDALYELVERVDQKVDALDIKLDRRFDEISGQLSDVGRQLGGR